MKNFIHKIHSLFVKNAELHKLGFFVLTSQNGSGNVYIGSQIGSQKSQKKDICSWWYFYNITFVKSTQEKNRREDGTLYQRFVELLEQNGKTVAQVSKETGIGQNTFSNWKKRGNGVSVETLYKLATYFGVPMEHFMENAKEGECEH